MNFNKPVNQKTFSNLGLVSELNLIVTEDTRIFKVKSVDQGIMKPIIETLLQNIHNCSFNNIVANSNHKADKVSFKNFTSPHEKSKMISNKSNQVDENGNHNNNDNQKTIIETKDDKSMTLDKRNYKSSRTLVGDKIPEKETK